MFKIHWSLYIYIYIYMRFSKGCSKFYGSLLDVLKDVLKFTDHY